MVIRLNRSVRSLIVVFCCVAIFIFSGCASLDFDLVDMGWQRGEALERRLPRPAQCMYNHNEGATCWMRGLLAHYADSIESNARLVTTIKNIDKYQQRIRNIRGK